MTKAKASATFKQDTIVHVALERRLSMQHAEALAELFRERRGRELALDASNVDTISTPCIQVMRAAAESWRIDGQKLRIVQPSDKLVATLATLGIVVAELQS